MTDLDKLIEAVEGGCLQDQPYFGMPMATALYKSIPNWNDNKAVSAYHGSLDAAKALHEALLPEWAVERASWWPRGVWTYHLWGTHDRDGERWHNQKDGRVEASDETAARAWLIAILKAYRSQHEK